MDFETFAQQFFAFLKQSDNAYFVLYAVATCIFTQVAKKLFVNKVKVDVLHKFDFAEVLPFLFGGIFAVVDLVFVRHAPFNLDFVANFAVGAITVGALAVAIFKFVSSLSGKSLKTLLKDDAFCVFYTQLLYVADVRKRLTDKSLSLKDFLSQVKSLAESAKAIYAQDISDEETKQRLLQLLAEEDVASQNVDALHNQLCAALKKTSNVCDSNAMK